MKPASLLLGAFLVPALLILALSADADGVPSVARDGQADQLCSHLGRGAGVVVEAESDFPRDEWEYWEHSDGTFENGFCWHYYWHEDPYYSAVAEGFSGPAEVRGIRVYLTQIGCYVDETLDLFVWGAGIDGPGCVLAMIPDAPALSVPSWPEVGANDYEIAAAVGPRFYVGANGVWPDPECLCPWFHPFDVAGPPGDPWTCCHPGMGGQYPEGWVPAPQAADILRDCTSWGLGVYVEGSASVDEFPEDRPPPASPTWGQIKTVFR